MKQVEMGGLTVRLGGGTDRDGGGGGPVVVLLHGFGAPGDDLASLGRIVDAPPGTRWAFPAAPLVLPSAGEPGWARAARDARAWWLIDIERQLSAAERGDLDALSREIPAGLVEVRAPLDRFLDALEAELRPTSLVLGGFSQGAILACDAALRTGRALAGIALLSGTLIAADEWAMLASRRRGLAAFQSHGVSDPLLPFAHAEKLRELLRAGGIDVTWVAFRGAHEIPDPVLMEFGRWLRKALH